MNPLCGVGDDGDGFGNRWKAYDKDLGVEVAMHEIPTEHVSATKSLATDLEHPIEHDNIMQVIDMYQSGNKSVYILRIVTAGSLRR